MELLSYLKDLFRKHKEKLHYIIPITFILSLAYAGMRYDKINVDNIQIDGNTVSTTNTNGTLILSPNGSGSVQVDSLTANRALYTDASKHLKSSAVTDTELGYLSGVTSSVVGISDTQTLTNKTLTSPTINDQLVNLIDFTPGTPTNPASGKWRLYFSSSSNLFNYKDSTGSGHVIVDTNTAQNIYSKTLSTTTISDDLTFLEQSSTPLLPSSGYKKFYAKNDGKLYTLDSAGNEVEVGSGAGGSGGINYVQDWDAESGNSNVTVTSNITKALETTNPLRDSQSHYFTISTSATTSDYISFSMDTFHLSDTEKSKPIYVTFDYKVDSNYTADDLQVVVNDGSSDLTLNDSDGLSGKLPKKTNVGRFTGVFYTTAGTTSYTLRLNVLSAPSTASHITIDNIKVGPDSVVPSAIDTKWQSYTPTTQGFGTLSNIQAWWRRNGPDMLIRVKFTSGTVDTNQAQVSLPSGYTMDSSVLAAQYNNANIVGTATVSGNSEIITVLADQTDLGVLKFGKAGSSFTGQNYFLGNQILTSTQQLTIEARVPISNWSAGASVSTTETLFSTVKARYKTATAQSIPNGSTTTRVDFGTKDFDSHNTVTTGSSWKFTAPKSGTYRLTSLVTLQSSASWNENAELHLRVNVNGSFKTIAGKNQGLSGSSMTHSVHGSVLLELNKGDYVYLTIYQTSGVSLNTHTDSDLNWIEITELPDFSTFSVYGETEVVSGNSGGLVNYTITAGNFGDLTSFTLTPGEWDISALLNTYNNGTMGAATNIEFGISTTSGNSSTGLTDGVNFISIFLSNTASTVRFTGAIPKYKVTVTTPTTYYLKAKKYTSITNLQVSWSYHARKIK